MKGGLDEINDRIYSVHEDKLSGDTLIPGQVPSMHRPNPTKQVNMCYGLLIDLAKAFDLINNHIL